MNCHHSPTYCEACISYLHTHGNYPKSCIADDPTAHYSHALNCPCDQCRPDLATKRANQAFHAELVKLNRNVEGLAGTVEKLAEAIQVEGEGSSYLSPNDRKEAQRKHNQFRTEALESLGKVEPKKAEGSNEGGFMGFSVATGVKLGLDPGCVYRVGEDGTVSQWTKMLGEVRLEEITNALCDYRDDVNARRDDHPGQCYLLKKILTNFARSRGLMP